MNLALQKSQAAAEPPAVEALESAVRSFLRDHYGERAERMETVASNHMVVVTAFGVFGVRATQALQNQSGLDFYRRFLEQLFKASEPMLRERAATALGCNVAKIRYVFGFEAHELDIIFHLDRNSGKAWV